MAQVKITHGPGHARLAAALAELGKTQGRVGWFASAQYPDGTPVAYVAAIQEFGYAPKGITPRMGLRPMADREKPNWSKVVEQGVKQILDGRSTGAEVMNLIGGVAEAAIRKQITSVVEPLLKDTTLERRAKRMGLEDARFLTGTGAKPLVDTGHMIGTVTHVVEEQGAGEKK